MIIKRKYKILSIAVITLAVLFTFCLPDPLFSDPLSTAVYDREGYLMNAHIANDGQWRFAEMDSVPYRFQQAILLFEDKRFQEHWGVDLLAMSRAIKDNITKGEVVSGASTITMQLMRMARKGQSRNIYQKLIESIWAVRAEIRYSKEEILALYASHAPFGGNVVGLDAAAWRYFGRSPFDLSWAEAATLAVLPNQPSMIHPGRNRDQLRNKRDRLLRQLHKQGTINQSDLELALLEVIPTKAKVLPRQSPHLMEKMIAQQASAKINTTIDGKLQQNAISVVDQHYRKNISNDIHNAAVLIIDNRNNKVLAYVANTRSGAHESAVNMIQARRSSGSILKPLLYASMIDAYMLTPDQLVYDIPQYIDGYAPQNYHQRFAGAIPASEALAKSLNVPVVLMLKEYGVDRFLDKLQHLGLTTLNFSADHYGLPLILGGGEVNLWEMTNIYAAMSRTLEGHYQHSGKYAVADWQYASISDIPTDDKAYQFHSTHLSASAIWSTYQSLQQLSRPDEEGHWQQFSSSRKLAWKTGTSYGHRDAWAIGTNPDYTIGVWVGNADGEGRPDNVGIKAAGSLLFDILNLLPRSDRWFYEPMDEMLPAVVCRHSGYLAGLDCEHRDTSYLPVASLETASCPFHQRVHLDPNKQYRVNSACANTTDIITQSWFTLPPLVAQYYQRTHADYEILPEIHPDCKHNSNQASSPIALEYPYPNAHLYLPVDVHGEKQKTIAKAIHRKEDASLHWHLDGKYLGTTETFHTMPIDTPQGTHTLVIVDDLGNKVSSRFEVVGINE